MSGPGQWGQVLLMAVLVLSLVGVGLLATVGDLAVLASRQSAADTASYLGAEAGAADLLPASTYQGQRVLASGAADVCAATAQQNDLAATVTCTQSAAGVRARVRQVVALPIGFFGSTATVAASRRASIGYGAASPAAA
ncbi:MAG TPA: hypothetical protein VMW49_04050 [Candidatus Dormibacteraeota bacterium]|nr:hypothetical protein [Candidatus Dormibacteraeota bacterium]